MSGGVEPGQEWSGGDPARARHPLPPVGGDREFRARGQLRTAWGPYVPATPVTVVLDEHALQLIGRGSNAQHAVFPYGEIAKARAVRLRFVLPPNQTWVELHSADGGRIWVRAGSAADAAVAILRARGVPIDDALAVNGFALGLGGTSVLGPRREPPVPADGPPRRSDRGRVAKIVTRSIVGVVLLLVVFVVVVAIGEALFPSDANMTAAEMRAATVRVDRSVDAWHLPPTVVVADDPEDTERYGMSVQVTRHFLPAPGVTQEQAADDLVAALTEEGYGLQRDESGLAWSAQGDCRLRAYRDCLLSVGPAPGGFVDAVFLP